MGPQAVVELFIDVGKGFGYVDHLVAIVPHDALYCVARGNVVVDGLLCGFLSDDDACDLEE